MTGIQATEYTFFSIIFLCGVTGNTLVCLVISQTPRMRTTRNFLLVNLAVSDLMVALLCIPFDITLKVTHPVWPLGAAMCKLLWPAMTLFTNCSAATLAAISYDRQVWKTTSKIILCLFLPVQNISYLSNYRKKCVSSIYCQKNDSYLII